MSEGYQAEILWGDPKSHEADRYLKCLCSANFSAATELCNFSCYAQSRFEVRYHIRKCEEIPLRSAIWWPDVMYREVNHHLKWLCSANVFFSDLGRPRMMLFSERLILIIGVVRMIMYLCVLLNDGKLKWDNVTYHNLIKLHQNVVHSSETFHKHN